MENNNNNSTRQDKERKSKKSELFNLNIIIRFLVVHTLTEARYTDLRADKSAGIRL